MLGDDGGGSILTASPFSLYEDDRGTSRVITVLLLHEYNTYLVRGIHMI